MVETKINAQFANFLAAITKATNEDDAWKLLHDFTLEAVGAKLFTFTTVDLTAGIAKRAYTSDAKAYPVTGEKPVIRDEWFETVLEKDKIFVANAISEVADMFPDYDLISSLGCESVVNIPVHVCGELVGTANLLHEENYYSADKVAIADNELRRAAQIAVLAVQFLKK
jgi:hypothetical protein